jgi:hypothetical protein
MNNKTGKEIELLKFHCPSSNSYSPGNDNYNEKTYMQMKSTSIRDLGLVSTSLDKSQGMMLGGVCATNKE